MFSLIKATIILGASDAIRLTRRPAVSQDQEIAPTALPADAVPYYSSIGLNSSRAANSVSTSAVQVKNEYVGRFVVYGGFVVGVFMFGWTLYVIILSTHESYESYGIIGGVVGVVGGVAYILFLMLTTYSVTLAVDAKYKKEIRPFKQIILAPQAQLFSKTTWESILDYTNDLGKNTPVPISNADENNTPVRNGTLSNADENNTHVLKPVLKLVKVKHLCYLLAISFVGSFIAMFAWSVSEYDQIGHRDKAAKEKAEKEWNAEKAAKEKAAKEKAEEGPGH